MGVKVSYLDGPPLEYRGSIDTDVAVRIFGFNEDGTVDLQLNLSVPEAKPDDPEPSPAQIESVQRFFPHVPATISSRQAHAILCYRDYARAVADEVAPYMEFSRKGVLIQIIATLVSHDERIAKDVRSWAERRFIQHSGDPRIKTTKHFKNLASICAQVVKDIAL
ncbi:hypothetical protein [Erythrobacter sp. EC-HK427]|uniref:hypothetical protein n=1 Tax=Erythrobacter sp. EC-HK427 TaxID=2038396 RepID=UPI00125EBEF0|nr:hypothetical protein [Erythrobacter sp. EC-HK427]